jgi:putative glutathione S-transferase
LCCRHREEYALPGVLPSALKIMPEEKKPIPGSFVRKDSLFRSWISDGETANRFPAEPGRYHLYISRNCPWAHRAALARELKGLQDVITMDVLGYRRSDDNEWIFRPEVDGCTADSVNGFSGINAIYHTTDPDYKGSATVPVLFDKRLNRVVSNESAEIIRMFNTAFNRWAKNPELDLYPEELREIIDETNEWAYHKLNNGVYRAGFAKSQDAYESAYEDVFSALDRLNSILEKRQYLAGDRLTEADIRVYVTLFRFDPVYFTRFKCNKTMIEFGYPNLWDYLKHLYRIPEFAATTNLDHIKNGYFGRTGNQIVPLGWSADYLQKLRGKVEL